VESQTVKPGIAGYHQTLSSAARILSAAVLGEANVKTYSPSPQPTSSGWCWFMVQDAVNRANLWKKGSDDVDLPGWCSKLNAWLLPDWKPGREK
jgi:hypothetical protein